MVKEECKQYFDEVYQSVLAVEQRKKNWMDAVKQLADYEKMPITETTKKRIKNVKEFIDVQKRFVDHETGLYEEILDGLIECGCNK